MFEAEEQHWWYAGLHALILTCIRRESQRLGRPLVIFDAGCGTGRLVQLMQQEGHRVEGCDAEEEALRFCRQRGLDSVGLADLNTLELAPAAYDVITSIDVLYHTAVRDDRAVMARLRRGLRPGGMLILNLVAHEFLRSTHDIAVHTRERYTRGMLCERLRESGFTIECSTYRVSFLFPFIAAYRLLLRYALRPDANPQEVPSDTSLPHRFINVPLTMIMKMENKLFKLIPLPFGSSLFVIARNRS